MNIWGSAVNMVDALGMPGKTWEGRRGTEDVRGSMGTMVEDLGLRGEEWGRL